MWRVATPRCKKSERRERRTQRVIHRVHRPSPSANFQQSSPLCYSASNGPPAVTRGGLSGRRLTWAGERGPGKGSEVYVGLFRARTVAVGLLYRWLHFHTPQAHWLQPAGLYCSTAPATATQEGLGGPCMHGHMHACLPPTSTCTRAIYIYIYTIRSFLTLEVQKQQN